MADQLVWFENLSRTDVAIAGGKGANLGEAVRSSAPSEDTASTSFAGMHETLRTSLAKSRSSPSLA